MSKNYVAMEQAACPACGETFDTGNLLLDKQFRDTLGKKVATHWTLCPEHYKIADIGYAILVECDTNKSEVFMDSSGAECAMVGPGDVYRTGNMLYVPKELAAQMGLDTDLSVCYIDQEVMKKIEALLTKFKADVLDDLTPDELESLTQNRKEKDDEY